MHPPCFDAKITCVDRVLGLAETFPSKPHVTHPRISVFAGCAYSIVLQMWHGVDIFMPMYPPCFDAKITCVARVLGLAETLPCKPCVTHPRISVFAGCAYSIVLQMWHGVDIFMPMYSPCFDAKITCVERVLGLGPVSLAVPQVVKPWFLVSASTRIFNSSRLAACIPNNFSIPLLLSELDSVPSRGIGVYLPVAPVPLAEPQVVKPWFLVSASTRTF
jgi:hypothetical protein